MIRPASVAWLGVYGALAALAGAVLALRADGPTTHRFTLGTVRVDVTPAAEGVGCTNSISLQGGRFHSETEITAVSGG